MGWVEVVFVDAGRVRQHRRSDIDNRTRQLPLLPGQLKGTLCA